MIYKKEDKKISFHENKSCETTSNLLSEQEYFWREVFCEITLLRDRG